MRNTFLLIILLSAILSPTVGHSQEPGWQWLNPKPEGNGVTSIYFTSDMTGYAATWSNAVMKTTDGGISWALMYISAEIILKEVQFVDSQTGYISTLTNKLCKTTNAGVNWELIDALKSDQKFRNIHFKDVKTGYCTYDNIYNISNASTAKTTDGGLNWIVIRSDTLSLQSRIVYNNSELYLAWTRDLNPDTSYIHKSTNEGATWFQISQFPFHTVRDLKFTSSGTGYLQSFISSYPRHYRTTNAGNSWVLISDSLANFQVLDDNNLVGILNYPRRLYKSSDGGVNWQFSPLPNYSNYAGKYHFINPNTGIITGTDYIRTTNGGTSWTITYDNISSDFWGMDFIDPNTGFLSGYRNVYKTTDGGASWDTTFVYSEDIEDIQFLDNQTGYMGCFQDAIIAKTTNCGSNWEIFPTSISYGITAIDFVDVNTGYATAKYGPVAKTTNGGLNWENVTDITGQSWGIDFLNANTGLVGSGGKLKRTSDGGITWTEITMPQSLSAYKVKFIDANIVLAAGSGGIYKSTDGGVSWSVSYITNNFIGELECISNTVYATSSAGARIYKSTDRGNTWRTYNTISYNSVYRIKFVNENTGYICGTGGMVIKTTNGGFDPIGIEPISTEIPSGFSLHQNYPNPFNPTTRIKFEIPKASRVRLTVYDILGRQVAELVNQNLNAGTFEYEWSGADLSSGIYFYKLEAGDFVETRRMVLVK